MGRFSHVQKVPISMDKSNKHWVVYAYLFKQSECEFVKRLTTRFRDMYTSISCHLHLPGITITRENARSNLRIMSPDSKTLPLNL
jgi:hypothetical protein